MPCAVEGCEDPRPGWRGWCPVHYGRWQRFGDPNASVLPKGGLGRRANRYLTKRSEDARKAERSRNRARFTLARARKDEFDVLYAAEIAKGKDYGSARHSAVRSLARLYPEEYRRHAEAEMEREEP